MTDNSLASGIVYKSLALFGTLLTLLTPYLSWTHLTKLEPYAVEIFEQQIIIDLDIRSLNQQYGSLENAIESSNNRNRGNSIQYSETQLEQLKIESAALDQQIEQRVGDLDAVQAEKNSLISNVKITVGITLIVLTVAMVMAIFGFLGWYFDIKIFQERRERPRD